MDGLAIWVRLAEKDKHSFTYREGIKNGFSAHYLEEVFEELELNDYEDGIIEDRSNEYPLIPKEFIKWQT